MLDYKSALQRLLGLVDFERFSGPRGPRVKFDLGRMRLLLQLMGNPHLETPTVHIAGTKGKGSTVAMVSSVLARQGFTTGMFISPHLHSFRERICVNGLPVSESEFGALVEDLWPFVEAVEQSGEHSGVTVFELLTAMAFLHFQRMNAGFQVLEVGLGGRLDSTNLVSPNVTAITSVSLDHTSILGDTVAQIASEKAGIIKPGVPVVTAPQSPAALDAIRAVAREQASPIIEVGKDLTWELESADLSGQSFVVHGRRDDYRLRMSLLGDYQLENAAISVGILEELMRQGFHISNSAMEDGLKQVSWPCRLEVLGRNPLLLADGAHNPYSMQRLCRSLSGYFDYRRVILLFGASSDKNLADMVSVIAGLDPVVITTASRHPRSMPAGDLAGLFSHAGISAQPTENVALGLDTARSLADPGDLVLATGSLFVAAEVRELVKGLEPETYDQLVRSPSGSAPGAG